MSEETKPPRATNHKQRTRARILDEAAKAMRLHGTEGIGVAALMKQAGLTQGGFYAHFASRDDLVAHAVERMFEDSSALLTRCMAENEPAQSLRLLIDRYLSDGARLAPERTCPIPSLSGEAARLPGPARAKFLDGVARFEQALALRLAACGQAEPEALAASVLAEMVGAMALARAIEDDRQASAMLDTARARLKARLGL
jgi:TetR/AcrR family transcriptional regulator, transcriptional repressor for nem operon